MSDQAPTSETTPPPPRRGLGIPIWVAVAGMIVSLIFALIIMANILRPLVNLVFPAEAEAPLPPDSTLLETNENPRTSDGEWLYGSNVEGCELVGFFVEAGGTCNFAPFACIGELDEDGRHNRDSTQRVATCVGTESDIVNSYSWEVLIGSGYTGDYYTKFRVYLYKER